MKTLFTTELKNTTPELSEFTQMEVETLEEAIMLYEGVDPNSQDASILVWADDTGYTTYASTFDNIPIPQPPELP
jgi:hypothetical protein